MLMMVALGACVKEIYYDDIAPEPLLVVNGIQQVGEPARLYVEKSSFYISAENDFRVKDAKADLYVNGLFKESLQVRDSLVYDTVIYWEEDNETLAVELRYACNYCEGSYILCEGDELRFEVSSSEFDEVAVAETTMPYAPNVVSFDTVRVETNSSSMHTVYLALTLDDPAGRNYYNFNPQDGLSGFLSTDPVFNDFMDIEQVGDMFGSNEYYGRGVINMFTDSYFDGTQYSVTMKITASTFNGEFDEPYTLEVTQVDDAFYRYEWSYHRYQNTNDEIIGFFTEPTQVYSNVQNGVGLVGAKSAPVVKSIYLSPLNN